MFPILLPFAFALLGAVPPVHPAALASEQAASEPSERPQQEISRLFSDYNAQLFGKQFDKALATASKIEMGPDNRVGTAILNVMKASALLGLKRDDEALRMIAEAERLAPREPAVNAILFHGALIANRTDIAADAIDRLIARAPDAVREIDRELVTYFLRNEPKEQERRNEDRLIALARMGYGGDATGDYLASDAVEILLKRGDASGAAELVPYIDEPQLFEDMLIQKRYSALWPDLTNRAGPNLQDVRRSSVATAERAYVESPDHQRLQQLINALRHAGRHDEAIALRSKLPSSRDAMAEADEDLGWAVNNIALALHEVGRAPEADELFALLNEAPMANGEGRWRVSMIINRLELLVADGKFDKALALLEMTETSAKGDGNAYAQQLVRRLKYCTLAGLGRKDEAAKVLPEMLSHAKDAWHASVDGLICAGELDKAEQLIVEALKGENPEPFQAQLLRSLQPKPLTSDDPSIWHGRWTVLRQRAAIASEFERLGRDMPEQFLPPPIAQ